MRFLVISFLAVGLLALLAQADKPEDYPPPPPVPSETKSTSTTTLKPTTIKPTEKKKATPKPLVIKKLPRKVAIKTKQPAKPVKLTQPKQTAERRDSSYGPPAPPKRQVIIKQAGPSKQYAWVGHGRYAPLNIPNPFPKDSPKWVPMGNNIFEAGLLYPGKPGSKPPVSSKPPPPPPSDPVPSYSAPAPAPQPSYAPQASVDSYSAPVASSYQPSPQPVYNPRPTNPPKVKLPAEIPAQPAYQSSQPTYGSSSLLGTEVAYEPVTAVPAYTTSAPIAYSTPTTPPYVPPQTSYASPQPSYGPSKPFTAFGSQVQNSYNVPNVGKPDNFPTFNALPGFAGQQTYENNYEAQASYESTKTANAPVQNTYNAYDVPLKVEEVYGAPEQDDQDVYFIFYEEDQEPQSAPSLQGYVSEAASPPPSSSQFKPPSNEDIRYNSGLCRPTKISDPIFPLSFQF